MRAWRAESGSILFAIMVIVHLLPLWGFEYFPSQDGPAHLENATILKEYNHPERTAFRQFYVLNLSVNPNGLGHLVLAGLLFIFPLLIAEKIFLSGYVILFPVAVRYALGGVRPDARFLALLSFPFIYSYSFHMGFYYFSYSLVVFFFTIGYWLRYRDRMALRQMLMMVLLWLLLYFTHLVSLVMTWLALAPMALMLARARVLLELRPRGLFRSYVRVLAGQLGRPLLAFLPTLLLVYLFFAGAGTKAGFSRPNANIAGWVLKLGALVSYDTSESRLSTALALCFLLISLWVLVRWRAGRPNACGPAFLTVFGLYFALCFVAPERMSGGSIIIPRLALFPYFMLILWYGAYSFPGAVRRGITILAVVFAVAFTGLHAVRYAELSDYLEEYSSGMDRIEANKTLAPLCFSQRGYSEDGRYLSTRVKPFLHAAGYIAAKRRVVEFTNYEANTSLFPVAYRAELNPYKTVGMLELEPPRLNPSHLRAKADYALVWNVRPDQEDRHSTKVIYRMLEEEYDLIYTSPQRGLMRLYKLRR